MAFFYVVFKVAGKPAYSFAAVDQFTQYAIQLDIESSCTDKDILKNLYKLMEHPKLNRRNEEPITLVMDGPEHLKDSIEKIIAPGKVIFNSAYRKYISLEFVEAMAGMMKG